MATKYSDLPPGATLNAQSGFAISFWNGSAFESRWFTMAQLASLIFHWAQDATNLTTISQRNVIPLNDNVQNLGSATKQWKDLFVKGRILSDSTFDLSTERTIPNPNVNNNWSGDGNPYIGAWTALLTPSFGDLVSWSGTVYQNNSGTNSAVNPVADGGANWDVYVSPYIGTWNSASTYAQNDIVDFGGTIYTHLTTLQEVFKDLFFDGTDFYFKSNLGTWCKITSTKIEVPRVEFAALTIHGTLTLTLSSAGSISLFAATNALLSAAGYVAIGTNSGDEIFISNNSAAPISNNSTDKKGVLIACYGGTVGIALYNALALCGITPVVEHYGELVIGNAPNAQSGRVSFRAATNDATPTEILINQVAGKYFTIPVGCSYYVTIKCIATQATNGESSIFSGEGIVRNNGGTTSTPGITFTQIQSEGSMGTVVITATADNANDRLAITVTGLPGTDIVWNVTLDYLKNKFQ